MVINPIVGVYIPIIRIPSLKVGGFPSPTKRDNLDHGTSDFMVQQPQEYPKSWIERLGKMYNYSIYSRVDMYLYVNIIRTFIYVY